MKHKKQTSSEAFQRLDKFKKMYEANPSDMLKTTIDNISALANSLLTSEMKDSEAKFLKKHELADWWQLAQKKYPIAEVGGKFRVSSEICNRAEPKEWVFDHRFDALEKVQQLVFWVSEKRKQGFGCKEADLEKFQAA